jgi:lysyl-tRNA synthetase class 2
MQPLARTSDKDHETVEQFQLLVNGWELCKAYSELVNPLEQAVNFTKQAEAAAQGDEEATSGDDDFVEAMEYGMPPQSGFGMGIERVLAIITQQDNIRDVVMFPLMKPIADQDAS